MDIKKFKYTEFKTRAINEKEEEPEEEAPTPANDPFGFDGSDDEGIAQFQPDDGVDFQPDDETAANDIPPESTDIEQPEEEIKPIEEGPPPITEEMLQQQTEEAYQKGLQDGKQATHEAGNLLQSSLAAILEDVLQKVKQSCEQEKTQQLEEQRATVEMTFSMARKIANAALDAFPMAPVEDMLKQTLPLLYKEPALTINVHPETKIALETFLPQLTNTTNYDGTITVRENDMLTPSDCQIFWEEGKAELKKQDLEAAIEKTLHGVTEDRSSEGAKTIQEEQTNEAPSIEETVIETGTINPESIDAGETSPETKENTLGEAEPSQIEEAEVLQEQETPSIEAEAIASESSQHTENTEPEALETEETVISENDAEDSGEVDNT